MLLYLKDAGPSLQAALQLIKRFGVFSGLQINWAKSQILPLKFGAPTAEQAAFPLVRASKIKYLGVQVSRSLTDYIGLNIEPLYEILKNQNSHGPVSPLGLWGKST